MRVSRLLAVCVLGLLSLDARAQAPHGGLEVALHGTDGASPGRPWRVIGQAFEVRGLARLRPLPRAEVAARFVGDAEGLAPGPVANLVAGADGRFVIDVPIPAHAHGSGHVELVLREGEHERQFEVPVRLSATERITFHTDRRFYEPEEPLHLWALVRDARSGRPLPGRRVALSVALDGFEPREVLTDASGVAHTQFVLRARDSGAQTHATAILRDTAIPVSATQPIGVGQRTSERLLVALEGLDVEVAPAASFAPAVRVTTASGAPAIGAQVQLTVHGLDTLQATTDREGVARFEARAPAYLADDSGGVAVAVSVEHPAHGSARANGHLTLAVPLALELEVVPESGALVPEVPSGLLLRVTNTRGEAVADARVHVRGPGLAGRGEVSVRTDRNGLARVEARVAAHEIAALHDGSCGEGRGAIFDVRVEGPRDRVARRCVPVHEAAVRARVEPVAVAPGERVEVTITRRPVARGWPVAVLVRDAFGDLVGFEVLAPGRDRARFEAPRTYGVLSAEARPLDPNGPTTLGVASVDVALVRPNGPSFPRLSPEERVYPVGGEAVVRVEGTERGGWAAVDVRDLAQHGGERPFVAYFLEHTFREALLDPATPDAERLLRAALVEHVAQPRGRIEIEPLVDAFGRPLEGSGASDQWLMAAGDLRDPRPDGIELVRRGLFETYRTLEAALADGSAPVEGEGPRRRFADEVLEELGIEVETLGGETASLAAIEDADPSFTFERAARRVARARLVRVLASLVAALAEGSLDEQPPERWLSTLVRSGQLDAADLRDPWDHVLGLRARPATIPALAVALGGQAFAFPGPDGRLGTADDVLDPFAREVPTQTAYAIASGEDALQRQLALLSPGPEALAAMLEAYARITRAMEAAQIGDAAFAEATQGLADSTLFEGGGGLGLHGSGSGGGGSGYGRGAGGFGSRSSRAPQLRVGHASTIAMGSLRGLVRDDLPATLRFVPSLALEVGGPTTIRIPLADAATTYLVEAIHWREDGWTWSGSTRVRVDREVIVDAPVPETATVGDALELPIRVRSQGATRTLRLLARGERGLTIDTLDAGEVEVPADEARVLTVRLPLSEPSRGRLVVAAFEGETPRDAAARALEVVPAGRTERISIDSLVPVGGEFRWTVAEDATWRDTPRLEVSIASSAFGASDQGWVAWGARARGEAVAEPVLRSYRERLVAGRVVRAQALGILWDDRETSDDALLEVVSALTPTDGQAVAEIDAWVLLALAPATRRPGVRPRVSPVLQRLVETLRDRVEAEVALSSASPAFHAAAAAALAWIGEGRAAREADRRASRHLVTIGEETWLQAYSAQAHSQNVASTALLALARLGDDRPLDAFPLVRTLTRWAFDTVATPPRRPALGMVAGELARAASSFVARREVSALEVEIDGRRERITLDQGRGSVELGDVARGTHVVRLVDGPRDGAVLLRVEGELRRVWRDDATGPLALGWRRVDDPRTSTVDARTTLRARRDARDTLVLHVRNRTPRALPGAMVQVQLPAGAELDAEALAAMRAQGRTAHVEAGVLTLGVGALLPSRATTIPLAIRWSVAGRLAALGTAAWSVDRPDAVTVLAPIRLDVVGEVSR